MDDLETVEVIQTRCWCYGMRSEVTIHGIIKFRRQADVMLVVDCERRACPKHGKKDCLIGKLREGVWP